MLGEYDFGVTSQIRQRPSSATPTPLVLGIEFLMALVGFMNGSDIAMTA